MRTDGKTEKRIKISAGNRKEEALYCPYRARNVNKNYDYIYIFFRNEGVYLGNMGVDALVYENV
jgi:hypothetical protein